MHYFIDGYNLMFRILRAGDDLTKQRQTLIQDLSRKIRETGLNATLVFDAQYQSGESSRINLSDFEIYFTDQGESADEFILKRLRHEKNPQQQVVVTSDKKLAWLARRKGAKTETVEDFLKQLNNRYKNKLKRVKNPLPKEKIISQRPPETLPTPALKSSSEDCQDYYLTQFEMRFQEMIKDEPTNKSKKEVRKKISKKPPKAVKEANLTDEERWLKAFNRDLDQKDST